MPAHKPIRRGQLISPFGIGAMVDFPKDESLMPAGLDAWQHAKDECPKESGWLLVEERLQARLGVSHFRLPPDHREPDRGSRFTNLNVPFIRFPRWHYCPFCGGMELLSLFEATRVHCAGRQYDQQSCHTKRRRPYLIPVRFVAVCEKGHVQDFPFMEWLHRDKPWDHTDHKLRLRAGRSSAGLSGITIECTCGERRNLGDVFSFNEITGGPLSKIGCMCKGLQPWLGDVDSSPGGCGEHLRVVQRGAANVYFPYVVSSIYLPLWAEHVRKEVVDVLEQPHIWGILSQRTVSGHIDPSICKTVAEMTGVDAHDLEKAAQRKMEGKTAAEFTDASSDEESFRRSEYIAIGEGKVGPNTELYVEISDLSEYDTDFSKYFSKICLVHKLRETRALVGFTRVLPPDGNLSSSRLRPLKLDPTIDWLPAIKVYGEGIFIELNNHNLRKWLLSEPDIGSRLKPLIEHYNNIRTARQLPHRKITPKFILLHTLAHTLINQLSFDCGYGSAALRERIYCDFDDLSNPMQGILIYTASGDSEGTMGGLVRQGKHGRLEASLRRAISRAAWCSSDPVCMESTGQGTDSANLAACHGCCLLPETSCEEGNRLLDRALLIGKADKPKLGYFYDLL